jgi:hypothetical protein
MTTAGIVPYALRHLVSCSNPSPRRPSCKATRGAESNVSGDGINAARVAPTRAREPARGTG